MIGNVETSKRRNVETSKHRAARHRYIYTRMYLGLAYLNGGEVARSKKQGDAKVRVESCSPRIIFQRHDDSHCRQFGNASDSVRFKISKIDCCVSTEFTAQRSNRLPLHIQYLHLHLHLQLQLQLQLQPCKDGLFKSVGCL